MGTKQRRANRRDEAEGYYSFPKIEHPFRGEIIKLPASEVNLLFQTFSTNGDPHTFLEKLERYDEWFFDKSYNVYSNGRWMTYIAKWLQRDKETGQ